MAFEPNMPAAARRNLLAADQLGSDGSRRDVAGYLYGIAAECAVKAMMAALPQARRTDLFFMHFPELRTQLRDTLQGRTGSPLSRFINDDRFLNNWHVSMRYSDGKGIRPEWVRNWQEQARQAVSAMES